MFIAFAYKKRSLEAETTKLNKIGFITKSSDVIFPLRNHLARKRLSYILKFSHKFLPLPPGFDRDNVKIFFLENYQTPDLFNVGLSSIVRNDVDYFSRPIKLPIFEPIDNQTRNNRWLALKSMATKGDLLFTYDNNSIVSKIISFVDRGPWSHSAVCTGEGTIIEAIASGVCERPIEVYAESMYRVGLYRVRYGLPDTDKGLKIARSELGTPYGYMKAALIGVQKFFRLMRSVPTPNDLAILPELELLIYV